MTEYPSRRALRAVLGFVWVSSLLLVGYGAFASRLLRPGADDYCFAVYADKGVLGGLNFWFENISGYYSFLFGAMAFVGWPLRHLPLSLASAIPFMLAALAVGVVGGVVLWLTLGHRSRRGLVTSLCAFPIVIVAWWTFLWLPQGHEADGFPRWMANGITHWQTLNGTYVMQTAAVVTIASCLWLASQRKPTWAYAYLPLGLVAGFGGAALVMTIALICVLGIAYVVMFAPDQRRRRVPAFGLLLAGALIGGLVSHFSPGTQSRQALLGSDTEVSVRNAAELLHATLPSAIFHWALSLLHVGALFVLVLSLSLGWLVNRSRLLIVDSRRAIGVWLILSGLSLTAAVASRFTELFAYSAYWHFIPTWLLTFLSLVALGVGIGALLSRKVLVGDLPVMLAIITVAVLLAVGALLEATTGIAERHAAWEAGAAPIPGMVSDLEQLDGMEQGCWADLRTLRDLPARGSIQGS